MADLPVERPGRKSLSSHKEGRKSPGSLKEELPSPRKSLKMKKRVSVNTSLSERQSPELRRVDLGWARKMTSSNESFVSDGSFSVKSALAKGSFSNDSMSPKNRLRELVAGEKKPERRRAMSEFQRQESTTFLKQKQLEKTAKQISKDLAQKQAIAAEAAAVGQQLVETNKELQQRLEEAQQEITQNENEIILLGRKIADMRDMQKNTNTTNIFLAGKNKELERKIRRLEHPEDPDYDSDLDSPQNKRSKRAFKVAGVDDGQSLVDDLAEWSEQQDLEQLVGLLSAELEEARALLEEQAIRVEELEVELEMSTELERQAEELGELKLIDLNEKLESFKKENKALRQGLKANRSQELIGNAVEKLQEEHAERIRDLQSAMSTLEVHLKEMLEIEAQAATEEKQALAAEIKGLEESLATAEKEYADLLVQQQLQLAEAEAKSEAGKESLLAASAAEKRLLEFINIERRERSTIQVLESEEHLDKVFQIYQKTSRIWVIEVELQKELEALQKSCKELEIVNQSQEEEHAQKVSGMLESHRNEIQLLQDEHSKVAKEASELHRNQFRAQHEEHAKTASEMAKSYQDQLKAHNQEFSEMQERYRNQINSQQDEHAKMVSEMVTSHQKQIQELEKDTGNMEDRHRSQANSQQEEYTRKINEMVKSHQSQIQDLNRQLTELEERNRKQTRSLQEQHTQEVSQLRKLHQSQLQESGKEMDDLEVRYRKQINSLQEEHTSTVNEMIKSHQNLLQERSRQMDDMEDQYKNQLRSQQTDHTGKVDEMMRSKDDQIRELKKKIHECEDSYRSQIHSQQEEYTKTISELEKSHDNHLQEHKKTIRDMEDSYRSQTQSQQDQHAKTVNEIRESYEKQAQDLKDKHAEAISELEKQYQQEQEGYTHKLDEMEKTHHDKLKENTKLRSELEEFHSNNIKKIKADFMAKLDKLTQSFEKKKADFVAKQDELAQSYEKKIQHGIHERSQMKEHHDHEIEALEKQLFQTDETQEALVKAHNQAINEMEKCHSNQLKVLEEAHKKEINNLEEQHKTKVKAQLADSAKKMEDQGALYLTQMREEKRKAKDMQNTQEAAHATEMKKLEDELHDRKQGFKHHVASLHLIMDEQNTRHNIAATERSHFCLLLQHDKAEHISMWQNLFQEKVHTDQEASRWQHEIVQLKQSIFDLQEKHCDLLRRAGEEHRDQLQNMDDQIHQQQNKHYQEKLEWERAVYDRKKTYEVQIFDLQAEVARLKSTMEAHQVHSETEVRKWTQVLQDAESHAERIEQVLESKLTQRKAQLEAEVERRQTELQDQKQTMEAQRQTAIAQLEKELERNQAMHEDSLKREMNRAEKALLAQKDELELNHKVAKDTLQARYNQLNAEKSTVEREAEMAIARAKATLKDREQEMNTLHIRIEDLQSKLRSEQKARFADRDGLILELENAKKRASRKEATTNAIILDKETEIRLLEEKLKIVSSRSVQLQAEASDGTMYRIEATERMMHQKNAQIDALKSREAQLIALGESMKEKFSTWQKNQIKEHQDEVNRLESVLAQQKEFDHSQMSAMRNLFNEEVDRLKELLATQKARMEDECLAHQSDREGGLGTLRNQLQALKQEREEEINSISKKHREELANMAKCIREQKAFYEEQHSKVMAQLRESEHQWEMVKFENECAMAEKRAELEALTILNKGKAEELLIMQGKLSEDHASQHANLDRIQQQQAEGHLAQIQSLRETHESQLKWLNRHYEDLRQQLEAKSAERDAEHKREIEEWEAALKAIRIKGDEDLQNLKDKMRAEAEALDADYEARLERLTALSADTQSTVLTKFAALEEANKKAGLQRLSALEEFHKVKTENAILHEKLATQQHESQERIENLMIRLQDTHNSVLRIQDVCNKQKEQHAAVLAEYKEKLDACSSEHQDEEGEDQWKQDKATLEAALQEALEMCDALNHTRKQQKLDGLLAQDCEETELAYDNHALRQELTDSHEANAFLSRDLKKWQKLWQSVSIEKQKLETKLKNSGGIVVQQPSLSYIEPEALVVRELVYMEGEQYICFECGTELAEGRSCIKHKGKWYHEQCFDTEKEFPRSRLVSMECSHMDTLISNPNTTMGTMISSPALQPSFERHMDMSPIVVHVDPQMTIEPSPILVHGPVPMLPTLTESIGTHLL